ncbi:MAG: hypothetical protein A2X97_02960 [Bdellovibrionales bacterium GWA1_52_35]|nr:MAG: hypothetical protein A2X97_02960 [Bdellovibrionales bacterium GWA1_52_35]HCM40153.1 hypothetical protein [Bdellovibrionales bacterium]
MYERGDIMGRSIFVFLSIFLSSSVQAAPSISGVSGQVIQNQTITISGANFGVKSPAAPILFDSFEGGTNAARLSTDPKWVPYTDGGGFFSSANSYTGALSAHNRMTPTEGWFRTSNFFFSPTDEIYYSYMYKFVPSGSTDGIHKVGRSNSTASLNNYGGAGVVAISNHYVYWENGAESVYPVDRWVEGEMNTTWTRHEIFKRNSIPAGTMNGEVQIFLGANQEKRWQNVLTRASGYNFQQNSIILGLMYDSVPAGANHNSYVDDVYVDKTRARIELGDQPSFNSCNFRVVQIPQTWSATGTVITAKVNTGHLQNGQAAYLFVVDRDGNASPGYRITVGGGSAQPAAPRAPTNFQVN